MIRHLLLVAVVAFTLSTHRDALAVYKFCAEFTPTFVDSGFGEDFLTGGTVKAHRLYMKLYRNDVQIAAGDGDPDGCILGTYSQAGTYRLNVYPRVRFGSDGIIPFVNVYVHGDDVEDSMWIMKTWSSLPSSTGSTKVTKNWEFTGATLEGWFRVAAVIALAAPSSLIGGSEYFPYYKERINSNGSVSSPPVAHSVLPSTPYKWMENECDSSMDGKGTEMDWLSFLYHVRTQTSNAYSWSDLRTVFRDEEVCDGNCAFDEDGVTWEMMGDGVEAQTSWSNAKRIHFTALPENLWARDC